MSGINIINWWYMITYPIKLYLKIDLQDERFRWLFSIELLKIIENYFFRELKDQKVEKLT